MKLKKITATLLLIILSLIIVAQIDKKANALHNLITSPVTGPVTGPITGPLTSPASLFKISGNIRYHLLGMLRRGAARFVPAAGVKVEAIGFFNNDVSVATTTDASGNYTLNTAEPGIYRVKVSGGETSFYVPPIKVVPLNKPAEKKADFQGLMFKF
ncbi:MAG TPA: carboxypeptidase-like regulatory domain-containing protein [Candidatus Limnocylindrales bacterium]|nr:carboxypeptidase-like regulatory domain-containing protein [Candidatus Limnocylindrales bacterium]